jgi:hypothetical protein
MGDDLGVVKDGMIVGVKGDLKLMDTVIDFGKEDEIGCKNRYEKADREAAGADVESPEKNAH